MRQLKREAQHKNPQRTRSERNVRTRVVEWLGTQN